MKRFVKQALNVFGFQLTRIRRHTDFDEQYVILLYWLEKLGIDLFLDVGANSGQTAKRIRSCGYFGDIVSFEPHPTVFEELCNVMQGDTRWEGHKLALGDGELTAVLNDADNGGQSSSLRNASEYFRHLEPGIFGTHSKFEVSVQSLDNFLSSGKHASRNIFLKIDTQGYEENVLKGAIRSMDRIKAVHLELSLYPLYEGQLDFVACSKLLEDFGFRAVWLTPGFQNKSLGRMFEIDAIFVPEQILQLDRHQREVASKS